MPLAVKCFFSEDTARPIRRIWRELAASGLATFLQESNSTPGVTLGVLESADEGEVKELARVLSCESRPFSVSCWGIGSFLTDPAHVFLGVVQSEELQSLHRRFSRMASGLGVISQYYRPGSWVPHSTLAIRCRPDLVPKIVQTCILHESRISARIDSLSVVETETARVAGVYSFPSESGELEPAISLSG
jgi:2'-5' RNA ligase